jgi:hypothetical protein
MINPQKMLVRTIAKHGVKQAGKAKKGSKNGKTNGKTKKATGGAKKDLRRRLGHMMIDNLI